MFQNSTIFPINDTLLGQFRTHGPDHICIIFYRISDRVRVGSYVSELLGGANHQDYFSELCQTNDYCVSLQDAINIYTQESNHV